MQQSNDITLLDLLRRWRAAASDRHVVVDYDVSASKKAGHPVTRTSLTGEQLWDKVIRAAAYLRLQGVKADDVVAVQLPTWHEYLVTHLAAYAIGAITMPISPIFRAHDLSKQLELSRAKVLVIPSAFGSFDFCKMALKLQQEHESLTVVLAVGSLEPPAMPHWQEVMRIGGAVEHRSLRDEIASGVHARRPDDLMLLNYSSGTTGNPKGIMHSTRTVLAAVSAAANRLELTAQDSVLVAVTIGHAAGYLNGMYLPLWLGAKVVYQDGWDADVALHVLAEEAVTYMPAMPAFLYDLAYHPRFTVTNLQKWTKARVSGSAISRPLMAVLQEHVPHLKLCPGWGLSEVFFASCGSPHDPVEKRNTTEGKLLDGYKVEIRDPKSWEPCSTGTSGEIVIKAPSLMLGYFKQEELTANAFTPDGWLKTGDLGNLDSEGYLTLVGRSKELIIRGGENLPVVEVEQLLRSHEKIADVALIGIPDERLGEKACAVVTCKPDREALTFIEMKQFLVDRCLTNQFIPEYLVCVDEMPKTAVGKIKKFELRQDVLAKLSDQIRG